MPAVQRYLDRSLGATSYKHMRSHGLPATGTNPRLRRFARLSALRSCRPLQGRRHQRRMLLRASREQRGESIKNRGLVATPYSGWRRALRTRRVTSCGCRAITPTYNQLRSTRAGTNPLASDLILGRRSRRQFFALLRTSTGTHDLKRFTGIKAPVAAKPFFARPAGR